MIPELSLDQNHEYFYQGVPVPGVTRTLQDSKFIDFTGIPTRILDQAAERGRIVHQAVALIIKGTLDADSVSLEYHGYLQSFESFCRDMHVQPLQSEVPCFHHQRRYAGTFDLTALIEANADLALIDFKTGAWMEAYRLQLSAYANTLPQPRRYRRIGVGLQKDGRYKIHECNPADFERDSNTFFSAVNCAHWRLQEHPRPRRQRRGVAA